MKRGGTLFPICRIPSLNSPANSKASGNDPKRLNSGSENRRRSDQCMAPCMPRFPSLRRTVRAGFLGSNFTALNPCPVMWLSDDPVRTLSQYLNDRYFLPASMSAPIWMSGVEQPSSDAPAGTGSVIGPGCNSTDPLVSTSLKRSLAPQIPHDFGANELSRGFFISR